MASTAGISFSGFNGFDFNQIIEAIMQQERLPLTALQQQEQAVKDKDAALVDLGSQVAKLETSINKLTLAGAFFGVKVESSDSTVVKAALGNSALPGHYDVNVTSIAKAQVTTSTNGYANTTDIVADGGSISFTINGTTTTPITLTKATTLAELQDLIRATYGIKDSRRGVEGTFMWFMEEVGELAAALRGGTHEERTAEFADVLAWLATLANIAGVDLEAALLAKYGGGCPGCRQTPCACDKTEKP